ncbi:MAG: glycosyltransferase family 2 protein [Oscillospiraceae bacterium]|nr:glycosyltransferase family 2 protein [Oscillospiraceae bacterium]
MPTIAVLIPCFNEAHTIQKVIADFKRVLPEAQIYVYDNNSTDQTASLALAAGAIVRSEPRQGKGNVVRTMFRDINADCYLMADGDDTYPAEPARDLVSAVLDQQADMVVGDRLSSTYFQENKRPFHNSGNRMVRALINHLFHSNIKDIMTGYRAFSRDFVKSFPVLSKGFEIETEMTIHAVDKNFVIREIPVSYRDRPVGSDSKLNTWRDGAKVLRTIFRLYKDYKPFAFFSVLSLLLLLLSLLGLIPVMAEYFQTGLVPRFPTLIVAATLLVLAVLTFTVGVILDVIVKKDRQQFELYLNLWQACSGADQRPAAESEPARD